MDRLDHYLRWRRGDDIRAENINEENIDQVKLQTLDYLQEGYAVVQRQYEMVVVRDPEHPRVAGLEKAMGEFRESMDKLRAELKDEMVDRLARHLYKERSSHWGWDEVGEGVQTWYRGKARIYLSIAMGEEP